MATIIYGHERERERLVAEARRHVEEYSGVRIVDNGVIHPDSISTGTIKTMQLRHNCKNCGAPWEPSRCSYCTTTNEGQA